MTTIGGIACEASVPSVGVVTGAQASGWRVLPLKHLVRMVSGGTPSKDRPDFWTGEIPWVSPKDMKRWIVDGDHDRISAEAVAATRLELIKAGTVLIVVRGMILAHTFPIALSGREVTINQDMKALIAKPGVDPTFLAYALSASSVHVFGAIDEAGHGTKALRMEPFGLISIALPSLSEQRKIAAYLDCELAKVGTLIEKQTEFLTRLEEHRRSLITDRRSRWASILLCRCRSAILLAFRLSQPPGRSFQYDTLSHCPHLARVGGQSF
jgi:type I restriction enzyme S subunit